MTSRLPADVIDRLRVALTRRADQYRMARVPATFSASPSMELYPGLQERSRNALVGHRDLTFERRLAAPALVASSSPWKASPRWRPTLREDLTSSACRPDMPAARCLS